MDEIIPIKPTQEPVNLNLICNRLKIKIITSLQTTKPFRTLKKTTKTWNKNTVNYLIQRRKRKRPKLE